MKLTIQKYKVQNCGACHQYTEQILVNNQWICLHCACKYSWNTKTFVPCTTEEFNLLENDGLIKRN